MAQKKSMAKELFEWIEMIVLSACAVLLFFTFVARPARVDGPSMENTLHHGEMLLLSDILYEPEPGDILVFQKINVDSHPYPIVKRVIATEGETVDIDFDTWTVTITDESGNTRVLDESKYRQAFCSDPKCNNGCPQKRVISSSQIYPLTVGKGELFVMGDNRNHSLDSRSSTLDLVKKDEVIGKVLFRFFPLSKFGGV